MASLDSGSTGLKTRTDIDSDAFFGTIGMPKPHVPLKVEKESPTSMKTTTYTTVDVITIVLSTDASGKVIPPSAPTGVLLVGLGTTISLSTLLTHVSSPSRSTARQPVGTASYESAEITDVANNQRVPSPLARKLAVGLAVPAVILLLVACILLGIYLRRRHRSWSKGPASQSPRNSKSNKHDYNVKPLCPHEPLTSRSDSTFTTEAGPSYGSIPQTGNSVIPQLPELEGLTATYSPHSDHSSDDFGTYFSDLDDPFADAAATSASANKITPGVSPSSCPLRDRLSHESERRRRAIKGLKRQRSVRRNDEILEGRLSISERELGELVSAFEVVEDQRAEERKLRVRSEEDVWKGGERGEGHETPAELMASVPLS